MHQISLSEVLCTILRMMVVPFYASMIQIDILELQMKPSEDCTIFSRDTVPLPLLGCENISYVDVAIKSVDLYRCINMAPYL